MVIVESSPPPAASVYTSAAYSSPPLTASSSTSHFYRKLKKNKTVLDVDSAILQVLSLYISHADTATDTSLLPLDASPSPCIHARHHKRAQCEQHTPTKKYIQRSGIASKKSLYQAALLKPRMTSKSWLGDNYYHGSNNKIKTFSELELEANTFKNSLKTTAITASVSSSTTITKPVKKKKTVSFNETVTIILLSQDRSHNMPLNSNSRPSEDEDGDSSSNDDDFFDALDDISHEISI